MGSEADTDDRNGGKHEERRRNGERRKDVDEHGEPEVSPWRRIPYLCPL